MLFVLGMCATLALPPFFILPLLMVSYAGLLRVISGAHNLRRAFADGWWWGLGYFITGLYWICISLLVDVAKFGWLIPFTLLGLNGIIALYPALACAITRFLTLRCKASSVTLQMLIFCIVFSLTEFARGVLFTGFPWNYAGYSWAFSDSAMQVASLVGIHGLTLITLLAATVVATGRWTPVVTLWLLLAAGIGWGHLRLQDVPVNASDAPVVRLVQANISQQAKWDQKDDGIRKHLELSRRTGWEKVDYIIWSEAAVEYALNREPVLQNLLREITPPRGALITGAMRMEHAPELKVWNSVAAMTRDGDIHYYDKHHLVPFGEFVPFRHILPLEKITPGQLDFSRGPGPQTLQVQQSQFSPLICYEAIFPAEVVSSSRPQWLINVTNDAWFGTSTGPYQHFHMARMRAVEQGLPLIRVANTGISAVVDSYGRVLHSIPLNKAEVLDAPLPAAAEPTLYSKMGNKSYGVFISLLIIIALIIRWQSRYVSK